jgi:tryptophan aminotransferase
LKKLTDWLYGLQEFNHGRKKSDDWRVSVGTGSQDLLFKVGGYKYRPIVLCNNFLNQQAIASIFNPGDPVLVETPTYS